MRRSISRSVAPRSKPVTRVWIWLMEDSSRRRPSSSPEDRHGEITNALGDLLGQHPQRLLLLGDDEHLAPIGDVVADDVGDRVGLAGSWWTLDGHTGPVLREGQDPLLFGIGR